MAGSRITPTATWRGPQWPRVALRIIFGVVWLVDAILKWLPGFRTTYEGGLAYGGEGQPGWLQPWFRFWIRLQRPDAALFANLIAVAESLLALALLVGFARFLTYAFGLAFSVLIWGVAEGFGGPYGQGSVDVGVAIIYALVFAALLALDYGQGPDPLSVDAYLERRITWWHRIAEVGTLGGSAGQGVPGLPAAPGAPLAAGPQREPQKPVL
jgi:uncharacterized membrane protein YphA (DoxX/SURF4 family)